MAKEVWAEAGPGEDAHGRARSASMLFPIGAPNDAYAQYFIGRSYLAARSRPARWASTTSPLSPAAATTGTSTTPRSGGGQILICLDGRGWYQEWGEPARELHPGDVVNIPVGVKHWHGAASDSWFSHLAVEVPGVSASNEWLEPVGDETYGKLK